MILELLYQGINHSRIWTLFEAIWRWFRATRKGLYYLLGRLSQEKI